MTVSTGDSGYGVSFPASSPHVVAVGGTNLDETPNEQLAGLDRDRVEWHREWLQHRFRQAVMANR